MKPVAEQTKNLLVLELYGTLTHWWVEPLRYAADFRVEEDYIYRRPYLSQFLDACSEWYELGVWSSEEDRFIQPIVREIFPKPERLHFVWGERYKFNMAKNLDKLDGLGWPSERVLFVDCPIIKGPPDDTENTVIPTFFEGDENDDELKYLASYLHKVKDYWNFRKLNKRNWRRKIKPMPW